MMTAEVKKNELYDKKYSAKRGIDEFSEIFRGNPDWYRSLFFAFFRCQLKKYGSLVDDFQIKEGGIL